MPLLVVETDEEKRTVPFDCGASLRSILNQTDLQVRSGCRGNGACGLCRVRIVAGEVDEPTANERIYLNDQQIREGIRLACQVTPSDDLQIVLLNPQPKSDWKSLPPSRRWNNSFNPAWRRCSFPADVKNPCGVAVDLGTTHVSLSLHDLETGQRLAGRYGLNPQSHFGSDVMARLTAANESSAQAWEISRCAVNRIAQALADMASREGIDLQQLVQIVLVGNTAMLALLSERNHHLLLRPTNWSRRIDCLPEDTAAWCAAWGVHPQARIDIMPPLAGFVGSDLLAGVLATGLAESEAKRLFVDFGTNSEIALWDGQTLWVTAAAGGPAFEGSGLSCGMPAEPGAIYQLSLAAGKTSRFAAIAGAKPRGICGSGMVDLIAGLLHFGKLSTTGRFARDIQQGGFMIAAGDHPITLTKGDVDVFQRAKAAVGAGIEVLLAEAGVRCGDLQNVSIGGAFGHYLHVVNAQSIGLLPAIGSDQIELWGNTALAGCEQILLTSDGSAKFNVLAERAKFINLAQAPEFDELFFENLYLQPMTRT